MARNSVQFQKGLSETRFAELYGSEDRCREAVFGWRWPRSFVCPGCGGQKHCVVKTLNLYQCTSCRRQTSLIAGTIFASTKVPLRTWFRAMYHLTQSKDLQPRTRPPPRCDPEHRLEAQTQAHAGDDGAGCGQTPDRSGRDRRCVHQIQMSPSLPFTDV